MYSYCENELKKWGSLLRPDLYGAFRLNRQDRYSTAEEQLLAVVKWELAAGVKPLEAENVSNS